MFNFLFLTSDFNMARQLHVKDILIIGDSNIRRNIARSGRYYSQSAEIGSARNLTEFAEAVKMIEPEKFKIVIFAMITNIAIDAGNPLPRCSSKTPGHLRLPRSASDCLGPLFVEIRLFFSPYFN